MNQAMQPQQPTTPSAPMGSRRRLSTPVLVGAIIGGLALIAGLVVMIIVLTSGPSREARQAASQQAAALYNEVYEIHSDVVSNPKSYRHMQQRVAAGLEAADKKLAALGELEAVRSGQAKEAYQQVAATYQQLKENLQQEPNAQVELACRDVVNFIPKMDGQPSIEQVLKQFEEKSAPCRQLLPEAQQYGDQEIAATAKKVQQRLEQQPELLKRFVSDPMSPAALDLMSDLKLNTYVERSHTGAFLTFKQQVDYLDQQLQ